MIIIETCPKCGHDSIDTVLTSYPPIPKKQCFYCGWSWTGSSEDVVRVPFAENINSVIANKPTFSASQCETCPNNKKNGGSGICNCVLGISPIC